MSGIGLSATKSSTKRVFLWTVPRSCSTVLTKCVSFMEGVQVWFEPYESCYFNVAYNTGDTPAMDAYRQRQSGFSQRGGNHVVKKSASTHAQEQYTYSWVKSQLELECSQKYVFVKDTAYSVGPSDEFLPEVPFQHTFLVRHPLLVFSSYKKVISGILSDSGIEVDLTDHPLFSQPKLFYSQTYTRWEAAKASDGHTPAVIDADKLVSNTEAVLRWYFGAIGFPWKEELLHWNPDLESIRNWNISWGSLSEEVVAVWYKNAFASSCFRNKHKKYQEVLDDVDSDIRECVEYSMPFYNEMIRNE